MLLASCAERASERPADESNLKSIRIEVRDWIAETVGVCIEAAP
jgi:hypothetical protein